MSNDYEIMRLVEKEGILKENEIKDPEVWKRQNNEKHKNGWMESATWANSQCYKELMHRDKNSNWLRYSRLKKIVPLCRLQKM